jgi:hypothetical protein
LRKDPADEFFRVVVDGQERGYVRLAERTAELAIIEVAIGGGVETPVYGAIARLAQARGKRTLSGWLRPTPIVASAFCAEPRGRALPMLASLGTALLPKTPSTHFWSSDHF